MQSARAFPVTVRIPIPLYLWNNFPLATLRHEKLDASAKADARFPQPELQPNGMRSIVLHTLPLALLRTHCSFDFRLPTSCCLIRRLLATLCYTCLPLLTSPILITHNVGYLSIWLSLERYSLFLTLPAPKRSEGSLPVLADRPPLRVS